MRGNQSLHRPCTLVPHLQSLASDVRPSPCPLRHHRFRPRRLHRRHLCRPGAAGSGADRGHPAGRPADHHHRCGELSGLRRRDPGTLADGPDAGPGRACGDRTDQRRRAERGPVAAAVPPEAGFRRRNPRRDPDHRHRRPGQVAGPAVRAKVPGLRRVGLRHLRRLLLPRQDRSGGGRRQYGGGGGPVPHQLRRQARWTRSRATRTPWASPAWC